MNKKWKDKRADEWTKEWIREIIEKLIIKGKHDAPGPPARITAGKATDPVAAWPTLLVWRSRYVPLVYTVKSIKQTIKFETNSIDIPDIERCPSEVGLYFVRLSYIKNDQELTRLNEPLWNIVCWKLIARWMTNPAYMYTWIKSKSWLT